MSGTNNKQPLLSICIPTWNRAKFLSISLERFENQIKEINISEIELFISDNCSNDDTEEVVNKFKHRGVPITYNRNETNIGAARNFEKCIKWASGKYILLLGDDDVLKPGSLSLLLDIIRKNDYGVIYIHKLKNLKGRHLVYTNNNLFLKDISAYITFMSGSVFRSDIVGEVDSTKYLHTHLLQMKYFIQSTLSRKESIILNEELLEENLDYNNNGGFNYYEVFVKHFLDIYKEYVDNGLLNRSIYECIKKDIYLNKIIEENYRLLIRNKNILDENKDSMSSRKGYKIAGAKQILSDYYGGYWYYRLSWLYYISFMFRSLFVHIKKIFRL